MQEIIRFAEGNPGALTVAMALVEAGEHDTLRDMIDLGVTGPRAWLAYKDLGDQTIPTLVETVKNQAKLQADLARLGYGVE